VAALAGEQDESVASAIRGLAAWAHLSPAGAVRWLHAEGLDPASTEKWQGISAAVIPSVVWSLYAFLQAPEDYWAAVCVAIEAGGDTDTMAAITGAIAGARLGPSALPQPLVDQLSDRGEWRAGELTDLAERVARMAGR
jgi:ADP-ribosylglycohydrolase